MWELRRRGYVFDCVEGMRANEVQFMLSEMAHVVEVFKGKGKLEPIEESDPLF